MPYTLTFNTFLEKKPEHLENIVMLKCSGAFGFYGYELRCGEAEYCWFEYELYEGAETMTGNQCCYDPEDSDPPEDEDGAYWKLHILVDGYIVDDPSVEKEYLWMNEEEYFKCLPQQ